MPQRERPCAAIAGLRPAFRQTGLRLIVVVNGDKRIVHQVEDGKHVPLDREEGIQARRLAALDADDQCVTGWRRLRGQHGQAQ